MNQNNNNSSSSNSASHWCKAVIEDAVPTLKSNPAALLAPQAAVGSTFPAATAGQAASAAALNPAYLQYYQQYYNLSPPAAAVSTPSVQSTTASSAANSALNYKAALTQSINPSLSSISANPATSGYATWNNAYYAAAVQAVNSTPVVTAGYALPTKSTTTNAYIAPVEVAPKLPNPSRFAPADSTSTVNAAPAAAKPAPANKPKAKPKQPASLSEFLTRAIMSCTNEEERAFRTAEIHKLISKVTAEGRLHVHRWDLEPIPQYEPPASQMTTQNLHIHNSKSTSDLNSNNLTIDAEGAQDTYLTGKKRKSRWGDTGNTIGSPQLSERSKLIAEQSFVSLPDLAYQQQNNKKSSLSGVSQLLTAEELKMREKRANRFQNQANTHAADFPDLKKAKQQHAPTKASSNNNGEFDLESLRIVGTCQRLEKDYLRLTSAPLPSVVRPEDVLRKSIQLIKKKWDNDEVDYIYMCSQLKSIRQDLTVQHIQNEFTVHVYETHARVALECSDLNEYNQCQTQLKQLYAAGIKGNEREFIAYRILYYVYLLGNKKYTSGSSDIAYLMSQLSQEEMKDEAVNHALLVRKAVHSENYHTFFQLYKKTPNMGVCILDLMVDTMRLKVLQKMLKVYRPIGVSLSFVLDELGYDDGELGTTFIKKLGCLIIDKPVANSDGTNTTELFWNTKDTNIDTTVILNEEKLLL